MICRICAQTSAPFGCAKVLGTHEAHYFRCTHCGFIQVDEPFWLDNAHPDGPDPSDTGCVERNREVSRACRLVFSLLLQPDGHFLDFGGGNGLLVRMMRDYGLGFWWYDKYCRNIFARGFDGDVSGGTRYDGVTAIEVVEHLSSPREELDRILRLTRNVFLTTALVPRHNPGPGEWWYYDLEHGRHVSLFTMRSLAVLAAGYGLHLCSDGVCVHLLTERPVSASRFRLILRHPVLFDLVVNRFVRRPSLVTLDYERITGKPLI
ncbi:MAG: class I SAM-dependent methyltransferase [Verrucomicrobiota bacterium]|nr:class I SAM-dependent methyltransferase [Verrucomicrobiota bacterium]